MDVLIRTIPWERGEARVYRVPVSGRAPAGHVAASAALTTDNGPETLVFPCDEQGNVSDWRPLAQVRGMRHHAALVAAGLAEPEYQLGDCCAVPNLPPTIPPCGDPVEGRPGWRVCHCGYC